MFDYRPVFGVLFLSFCLCADVNASERTITGYSSDLTVRAGDTVEFKVSKLGGGEYQADLVRIINGDSHTRYNDMFRVDPVDADFAGTYSAIEQPLNHGS